MRVALAQQLGGIDSVELGDRPDPAPAAGQALIRVHGAGVGPWDVGFLSGGFPGLTLPFVPGQEVAGVVEAAGDGAGVQPGERVYASLFPAGGGFAELALASAGRLAPMPGQASFAEAAGLVIGGGTAHEGLVDPGAAAGRRNRAHHRRRGRRGQRRRADRGGHGRPPPGRGQPAQPRLPAEPGRQRGLRLPRRRLGPAGACRGSRRRRPAASMAPVARPATRPSVRFATAAGRSSSSFKVLPPGWSGASRANRSPPTSTGSGWRHCAAWSTRANCARRSRRCCRWTRLARRWRRSPAHTRGKIVLQIGQ